ncbi:MAG: hypothetical protein ABH829_00550 [archaeon]
MAEDSFAKKIYSLVVVNTLDKAHDRFDIHGLVAGTIVSTFGFLICLLASYVFAYNNFLQASGLVAELGVFAYLSIVLHHYFEFKRELWKTLKRPVRKAENILLIAGTAMLMVIVYIFLLNSAIGVIRFYRIVAGTGKLFVFIRSMPGLLVLALPLFTWKQLCKFTPVDEFVKWVMAGYRGGKDGGK